MWKGKTETVSPAHPFVQTARGKQSKGRHSNGKESKAKKYTETEKATSVVGQTPRWDEKYKYLQESG